MNAKRIASAATAAAILGTGLGVGTAHAAQPTLTTYTVKVTQTCRYEDGSGQGPCLTQDRTTINFGRGNSRWINPTTALPRPTASKPLTLRVYGWQADVIVGGKVVQKRLPVMH